MLLTTKKRIQFLTVNVTCGVGVVVALQPCLHTNQIMLVHQEDDVLCPVNLIYKRVNNHSIQLLNCN